VQVVLLVFQVLVLEGFFLRLLRLVVMAVFLQELTLLRLWR
jgi:hypothetical protein